MLLEIAILGVLQGMLEWLPISSKGNLSLLMFYFLGVSPSQAFSLSIFIHSGTLLSAMLYLRRDIRGILRCLSGAKTQPEDRKTLMFILSATMLTGVIGLPLYLLVKGMTSQWFFIALTGSALIATGLIQRLGRGRGNRESHDLTVPDGVLAGVLQGLSALPGISRSGMTITALLARNFTAEEAFRLSFILSIPAVALAELGVLFTDGFPSIDISAVLLASVFSFITSLASMHLLLRFARRTRLWALCILLGIVSLTPLLFAP